MIPALSRLPEVPELVDLQAYFVVHAPRQTGKTTALRALAHELTAQGRYAAVHFSCELGRAAGDDYGAASLGILARVAEAARWQLPPELRPPTWPEETPAALLGSALSVWAQACPRPLVLFFDEIDALQGQSLLSVLSQLRDGYNSRPAPFPESVALCGLRDVREYKAAAGGDPSRLGTSSPFNIKLKSLRLGDLTAKEVAELYRQHTADTGQPFAPGAVEHAYELTGGQPWLVNALAREVVEEIRVPASEPITTGHLDEARDRLILARATHLDSLAAKLGEPRVRKIIGPLIAGEPLVLEPYDDDDTAYVRDLGLIASDPPVRPANPIYREVIVRVLSSNYQDSIATDPRTFVRPDGSFDLAHVLEEFTDWWIQNGEQLTSTGHYSEAAAQLILQGYLQRAVNGTGTIDREYAIGTGRVDVHLRWPYTTPDGVHHLQREGFEIKAWRTNRANPQPSALRQLDRYLDRLQLDTGVLAIFDQRRGAPSIDLRTGLSTVTSPAGRTITLLTG
jgi:hypothetical protein